MVGIIKNMNGLYFGYLIIVGFFESFFVFLFIVVGF